MTIIITSSNTNSTSTNTSASNTHNDNRPNHKVESIITA